MGASMVGGQRPGGMDFSSLNINAPALPIPGITSAREAQYARRLKEVEEELRALRIENEKNVRGTFNLVIDYTDHRHPCD